MSNRAPSVYIAPGEQQLRAALKIYGGYFGYDDLPVELRHRLERYLEVGRAQDAIRELDAWIEQTIRYQRHAERRRAAAARLKRARRAHGVRKAAPAWQRGVHRPRSIESSTQDPRVRGQLATRP